MAGLMALAALGAHGDTPPAKALPGEYIRLSSISSVNGNGAYIATGVYPTQNKAPHVEIKYKFDSTNLAEDYVFGYYDSRDNRKYGTSAGYSTNSGTKQFRFRVGKTGWWYKNVDLKDHTLVLNSTEGSSLDGETFESEVKPEETSESDDHEYELLSRNTYGGDGKTVYHLSGNATVYYCKIWMGEELVRDFVPCKRATDGEIGMCDLVHGEFYGSKNDAVFTGGEVDEPHFKFDPIPTSKWISESDGPRPTVSDEQGNLLTEGTDYTLSWILTDRGVGYVVITGKGTHTGYLGHAPFAVKFSRTDIGKALEALDFLESDTSEADISEKKGPYIKTGVVPNGAIPEVQIKYGMTSTVMDRWAFGYWDGTSGTLVGINNNQIRLRVGDDGGWSGTADTAMHEVRLNTKEGTYVDGKLESTTVKQVRDVGQLEYCLFGRSRGSGVVNTSSCRIYKCRIWLNGKLVRDFLPCAVAKSGICGLLDVVEGKFYSNNGTGNLFGYRRLKYAESTGRQGINTGVKPKAGAESTIEMEFQYTSLKLTGSNTQFWSFGYWNSGIQQGTMVGMAPNESVLTFRHRHGSGMSDFLCPADLSKHRLVLNAPDGTTFDSQTYPNFKGQKESSDPLEYYIFARNQNGSSDTTTASSVRIFGCKIWLDGELTADLRPIRRLPDGKVGMYDETRGKFLMPENNASLTAGPDLPPRGLILIVR